VKRPVNVTVTAQDREGNVFTVSGEGLLARAFCHEIDHLDGVLYVDKMEPDTLKDDQVEEAE
jgi:peptide deformylase